MDTIVDCQAHHLAKAFIVFGLVKQLESRPIQLRFSITFEQSCIERFFKYSFSFGRTKKGIP